MMNVNENSELTGKITLDTNENGSIAQLGEGESFKEKFNKMLLDVSNSDESLAMAATGAINPVIDFEYLNFDTTETYNYTKDNIENVDAMFFLNISNQGEGVNLQLNDNSSVIDASNYKTMEVSKTLGDLMVKAQENNKALRLDFDNQVTVVLKVSKEGKIDATFIPQDRQVENYLKNNIDYLKVRFDEQNIAYSNISYKPYKQGKNNNNNNRQGR